MYIQPCILHAYPAHHVTYMDIKQPLWLHLSAHVRQGAGCTQPSKATHCTCHTSRPQTVSDVGTRQTCQQAPGNCTEPALHASSCPPECQALPNTPSANSLHAPVVVKRIHELGVLKPGTSHSMLRGYCWEFPNSTLRGSYCWEFPKATAQETPATHKNYIRPRDTGVLGLTRFGVAEERLGPQQGVNSMRAKARAPLFCNPGGCAGAWRLSTHT